MTDPDTQHLTPAIVQHCTPDGRRSPTLAAYVPTDEHALGDPQWSTAPIVRGDPDTLPTRVVRAGVGVIGSRSRIDRYTIYNPSEQTDAARAWRTVCHN